MDTLGIDLAIRGKLLYTSEVLPNVCSSVSSVNRAKIISLSKILRRIKKKKKKTHNTDLVHLFNLVEPIIIVVPKRRQYKTYRYDMDMYQDEIHLHHFGMENMTQYIWMSTIARIRGQTP